MAEKIRELAAPRCCLSAPRCCLSAETMPVSGVTPPSVEGLAARPALAVTAQPKAVDMRKSSGKRREQQLTAKACAAFAFVKAMEIWSAENRPLEPQHDISPRFLWYLARQLRSPEGPVENIGVPLATVVEVIEQLGVVKEQLCPWMLSDIYKAPSLNLLQTAFVAKVNSVAKPILVEGQARVSVVHAALQKRSPVVFAYGMSDSWTTYSMLNPFCRDVLDDLSLKPDYYHAMVILGFDPTKGREGAFIVENSFGSLWGYGGFAYFHPKLISDGPNYGYWAVTGGPTWTE